MDCEDFDLIFDSVPTTCTNCAGSDYDNYCELCKISYLSERCKSPTRSLLHLNNILETTTCTSCYSPVRLTSDFMGLCNPCLIKQNTINPFITGNTPSEQTAIQQAFDYYMGRSQLLIKWPIQSNEYKLQQQIKTLCESLK